MTIVKDELVLEDDAVVFEEVLAIDFGTIVRAVR